MEYHNCCHNLVWARISQATAWEPCICLHYRVYLHKIICIAGKFNSKVLELVKNRCPQIHCVLHLIMVYSERVLSELLQGEGSRPLPNYRVHTHIVFYWPINTSECSHDRDSFWLEIIMVREVVHIRWPAILRRVAVFPYWCTQLCDLWAPLNIVNLVDLLVWKSAKYKYEKNNIVSFSVQ